MLLLNNFPISTRSLLETCLSDSTPCGISQDKDVATLILELFPVLDFVIGKHDGQLEVHKLLRITWLL